MEGPEDGVEMRVRERVALLHTQDLAQFEHVLDRERRDEVSHQLEAIDVLVSLLLRQDRRLVEASKPVDERLELLLVATTIALVLGLAELL